MSKYLYCGDFPELQSHFITTVSGLRRSGPLDPLTVLVTGQLIRLSLKRELARSGCSHANIKFLTLNEYAQSITKGIRETRGLRLVPDLVRDLLLKQAIESVEPQIEYFSKLKHREGFRNALWQTLDELRNAKVTSAQLLALSNSTALQPHAVLRQKLRELALILSSLMEQMAAQQFVDRSSVLELACGCGSELEHPLMIYGLDELSALETSLLEILCRQTLVKAYLPCKFDQNDLEIISEAYRWVEPVYRWYRSQGFASMLLENNENLTPTILDGLKQKLYLDDGTPSECKSDDRSFLMISAPGESRETQFVTRSLIEQISHQKKDSLKHGILVRRNEPYVTLFRDYFETLGISGYFHECQTLGETATGRAFNRFSKLLDGQYSREAVMDFVMLSPLKNAGQAAAEWNNFSYRAGITGGAVKWKSGLSKLKTTFEHRNEILKKNPANDGALAEYERELLSLQELDIFLGELFSAVDRINSVSSWGACRAVLLREFEQLVSTQIEEMSAIERELDSISELDRFSIPFSTHLIRQLLSRLLSMPYLRTGKFERHEPTVATLKQAKGVLFDNLYLCGMVEKGFPHSTAQDPILLDDERILISTFFSDSTNAGYIPLRSRQSQQEIYLFRTALCSARQRVVLSYPRINLAEGRELLPSQFLLKTLSTLTGTSSSYDSLKTFIYESPQGYFVPISRLADANTKTAISELEWNSAKISEALRSKSSLSLNYLFNRRLFLKGVESENNRFDRKGFTKYEGNLESAESKKSLAAWNAKVLQSFSPSRLETYATCPFQYFGKYVLALESLEEPAEIRQIDALQKGTLVHRILELFYQTKTPHTAETLRQIAQRCFEELAREETTGLKVLWENQKRQILEGLLRYIELQSDDEGFVPTYFEQGFGMSGKAVEDGLNHGALKIRLNDKDIVQFRGKIDRIDIHVSGEARIIDYKTGRKRNYVKDGELGGEQTLQLPIYRLAAEQMLNKTASNAFYHFVFESEKKSICNFSADDWKKQLQSFRDLVGGMIEGIQMGRYYPTPEDDKCSHCEVKIACGQGRFTHKLPLKSEGSHDE